MASALAVGQKPSTEIPLDSELKSSFGGLAPGKKMTVFARQTVSSKFGSITYLTGAVIDKQGPVLLDCFVFVKDTHGQARLFSMATKTESAWNCTGSSKIEAMNARDGGASMLVLSMFQYQAPSGDFFNLPLIVQAGKSGVFGLGDVDRCVEKKLDGVELKSISQLRKYAGICAKL